MNKLQELGLAIVMSLAALVACAEPAREVQTSSVVGPAAREAREPASFESKRVGFAGLPDDQLTYMEDRIYWPKQEGVVIIYIDKWTDFSATQDPDFSRMFHLIYRHLGNGDFEYGGAVVPENVDRYCRVLSGDDRWIDAIEAWQDGAQIEYEATLQDLRVATSTYLRLARELRSQRE